MKIALLTGNSQCLSILKPTIKQRSRKIRILPRAQQETEAEEVTPESSPMKLQGEKTAKKLADTFAPRPSGAVKNPAVKGSLLYSIFGYQAVAGVLVGGLLSFNVLFPSDDPTIGKLLGMWSVWMFSVPSWRARECTSEEKEALNILFLLLPLMNVFLPFIWKSFPFVFTADVIALGAVSVWKTVNHGEEASELLVVLLELHPNLWKQKQSPESACSSPLQQVLTFLNCFVLLSSTNELAVFAIHPSHCALIYQEETPLSEKGGGGSLFGKVILEAIHRVLESSSQSRMETGKEPCLSAALTRALCFMNSRQLAYRREGINVKNGRILIVNISADVPGQYISFMNTVFAAQHSSVLIDAAHLGAQDSPFLQQASYLTGGFYSRVKNSGWLLQFLNTYFASGVDTRRDLLMENGESVNFSASCFCHEQSIQLGFVCSVCLSVYCSHRETCLTCGTSFENST